MTTMYLNSIPAVHHEIQSVIEISAYKKWDRDREKEKEERRHKKNDTFQEMLEKKEEEVTFGLMGSFFEARA